MSASKLRGKAYADFLNAMTPLEYDDYMDAHPMERYETERAMTPDELAEYLQAINESLPPELQDDNDDDDDDDDDYEESYLPEYTGSSFLDSLNKRLNEHDREYWERRKKGIPFEKTV